MTSRFIPLAALAALAALACTPTVAPPAAPGASAAPGVVASAPAQPPFAVVDGSPAPVGSASPAASASPGAGPPSPGAGPASPGASASPAAAVDYGEACEHVAEGPAKVVSANLVTMSRARDSVAADHTRYDVGLVLSGGQSEGYVLFDSDEAGDCAFYLNKDVPFKLMQAGQEVAFEATEKPLAACADAIKAHYVAEVGVGQLELHFGPTSETTVGIVIERGAHDH